MAGTNRIRPAATAGLFYPGEAGALAATVDAQIAEASPQVGAPKALIAPHAGYPYSGPTAASAYAHLAPVRDAIRRVVILCPNHRVPLRGVAASGASAFETPLGPVPVDQEGVADALALPFVRVDDAAHADEHAIEVHLPFLQRCLDDVAIVPLIVGETPVEDVSRLLERLWGGPETLILISSDLSHYHPYEQAQALDAETCRAIEALDPEGLAPERACGAFAVRGLLDRARTLGLRATTLDLCNSGDTAGDRSRVVGYGAWAFEEPGAARLGEGHRARLKSIAKQSVKASAYGVPAPEVALAGLGWPLRAHRAAFVTVKLHGDLRGCLGSLDPSQPLALAVDRHAGHAACADHRFAPIGRHEAERVDTSITILSAPRPIDCATEDELVAALDVGRDGLILGAGKRRAVFLPQVWEMLPDPRDFVGRLKEKGGFEPGEWPAGMRAECFAAESF